MEGKQTILRYLCQKARKTHYLTHFERLTVLYVFGHMGEEGKEFIHKVMSFTLNYSYQTTQKFILHCPEKPVSCLKLREQYRQISAEAGCSCNFRRTKNCYPSPVLHALKNADENSQITMPVSRTIPAAQQQALKEEINARIFDDNGTDAMEIKAGLLVRRKKGDRTEWVIESTIPINCAAIKRTIFSGGRIVCRAAVYIDVSSVRGDIMLRFRKFPHKNKEEKGDFNGYAQAGNDHTADTFAF